MSVPDSEETESSRPDEYSHVYTTYGKLSGEMIRLLLNSVNIPVILSQESAGLAYGLTVGALGEVKIMVPASRADEARKILQEMEEGKLVTDINLERLASKVPHYKVNKLRPAENLKDRDL